MADCAHGKPEKVIVSSDDALLASPVTFYAPHLWNDPKVL